VAEEGFATAAPYEIEALLRFVAWGAVAEGVDDEKENRKPKVSLRNAL
jgi:hypothetical protein